MDFDHPRRKELNALHSKACDEATATYDTEEESNRLCDERWSVAEAMFQYEPKTIVDLAWQAEAWLLADVELYQSPDQCASDFMHRMIFRHIRTLGGLPQPDDPFGALTIETEYEEEA
jgi:hypothetical protein